MNRKSFLKKVMSALSLLGLGALNLKATQSEGKKWGFIHVNALPMGHPGNWMVIDKETGKWIKFKNESDSKQDCAPFIEYAIQYADDKTGLVGGEVMVWESYSTNVGRGRFIEKYPFHEIRNIELKYKNIA